MHRTGSAGPRTKRCSAPPSASSSARCARRRPCARLSMPCARSTPGPWRACPGSRARRRSDPLETSGDVMTAPVDQPSSTRPGCPVDINLVDPDTFETGVPLAAFATMREEAPVFWHEQPDTYGGGFWCVTRHADVVEVSRLPEVFSSYERGALLSVGGQDEEQSLEMTRLLMLNMDPPEHSSLRNLVQRAFTPRQIRALESRLQEFADDICDRAIAKGEGDLLKDVAAE